MADAILPAGYTELLEKLRQRIHGARLQAALAVNCELLLLYWDVGRAILERQNQEGWGAKVIEHLGNDLMRSFPDMKGLSRRNLLYMRAFAEAYPDREFVQQVAAHLPWFHNVVIFTKVKHPAEREWYLRMCLEQGWSRVVLAHQIENHLHERQGRAVTNFARTLPSPQSEMAQEMLKDPYTLDFIGVHEVLLEKELHRKLLEHLRNFMLELGVGFAFVGSEYRLEIGGESFHLDLLFYHFKLHCFVVVELKTTAFEPEHAGKLNFYLSAVDDLLRQPQDNPTIGILLCKEKNRVVVEYALRDLQKPLGVAAYRLAKSLPSDLKPSLPSVDALEMELTKLDAENTTKQADG